MNISYLRGIIKSVYLGRRSLVFALVKKQEQRERHKENDADIPKNIRVGFQCRLGVDDAVQGSKSLVMGRDGVAAVADKSGVEHVPAGDGRRLEKTYSLH